VRARARSDHRPGPHHVHGPEVPRDHLQAAILRELLRGEFDVQITLTTRRRLRTFKRIKGASWVGGVTLARSPF